jgi:hypothetical protein
MTMGELLEVVATCYGLPLGPTIPFPSALVNAVAPALSRSEFALGWVSKAFEALWAHVVKREGLTPAISATFDRELLDYATRAVIFDNSKLKRLGFTLKYKSLREGYPEVLKWFQENRWVPVYKAGEERGLSGSVGFAFAETMAGTWWTQPGKGGTHPFRFSVTIRSANARHFLRTGALSLEGLMDADGLATRQPCTGSMTIKWGWQPELHYDVHFTGDDGQAYRFEGKKQVSFWRFPSTISYLPGRLDDQSGRQFGRAITYFDLQNDLMPFLGSFSLQTGNGHGPEQPVAVPVTVVANSDVGVSQN